MEREGAMAVKWKAEWRRGGKSEGTRAKEGRNSQGKECRCGKEEGWRAFPRLQICCQDLAFDDGLQRRKM